MPELVRTARFDTDVLSIYEWLEEQNGGEEFYRQLLPELARLEKYPWIGSRIRNTKSNVRLLLVFRNRYAIVHTIENRGIIRHNFFDRRRDPEIMARLIAGITGGLAGPSSES